MKRNVFALVTFFLPISLSAQCIKGDCYNHFSTFKYPNGSIYSGHFKGGLPTGEGSLEYKNGDKYIGTWEKGVFSGQGKLFKDNGHYEGSFKMGTNKKRMRTLMEELWLL